MLTSEKSLNSNFNKLNIQYCQYCGKECHNLNSLKQHECRCKNNPDKKINNNLVNYILENRKGKTKENCEDIAKAAISLKRKYEEGYISPLKGKPGTFKGKNHSEETKEKIGKSVSKSRIEGYANGSITPARGVGHGKYSYIKYEDKTYMLRSTYEFIYALYLLHNNIEFEMENIRVPALRENIYAKTFICDFNVGNEIIEIKGIPSGKDYYIKEAFEAAGFKFKELFYDDIEQIKEELNKIYDIDNLLEKIILGHNTKNYFIYEYKQVPHRPPNILL